MRAISNSETALGGRHARPGPRVKGAAGCGDGGVHVGRARLDILQDGFLGVRRDHVEDGAARAGAPFAIDEEARGATRLDAANGFQVIFHRSLLKTQNLASLTVVP